MAQGVNIFDKYGIKEVANVYFEALEDDLSAGVYKGDIVLYLDSLKVSTIETSAENVAAQGGWGNPKLIQWDYGKEITLTLEDALMSLESLRFMLGGAIKRPQAGEPVLVHHTEEVTVGAGGVVPCPKNRDGVTLIPKAYAGYPIRLINLGSKDHVKGYRTQIKVGDGVTPAFGTAGAKITFKNPKAISTGDNTELAQEGDRVRIFWVEQIANDEGAETAVEVTISPDTFPGTYKVIGDTFMRSQTTGKDEMFQFVIGKAKVTSNVTIQLQAEGDPSTFEMTLNVLRDTGSEMMKLIRYHVASGTTSATEDDFGSLVAQATSGD